MSIMELDDLKAHLNVTSDDDDGLIQGKIDAAEAWIGSFIGHALDDDEVFPDGCPEPIKEAIRQLVGHLYANREATLVGVSAEVLPMGFFDLLAPHRTYVF
jgi:uncharacterized phage protein (predicted DNA packaging)